MSDHDSDKELPEQDSAKELAGQNSKKKKIKFKHPFEKLPRSVKPANQPPYFQSTVISSLIQFFQVGKDFSNFKSMVTSLTDPGTNPGDNFPPATPPN